LWIAAAALVFLIFASACGVVAFLAFDAHTGKRLLDEGYRAERRGDRELAAEKFTEALRHRLGKERASYAHGNLAYCLNRDRKSDDALREYTEAIRLNPKLGWAYASRAELYDEKHDTEKALQDYSSVIELDPNAAHAFYSRGRIYLARHQADDAIADFREAIRARPDTPRFYLSLGEAHLQKKNTLRAIASLETALRLQPRSTRERATAYNQLAWLRATSSEESVRNGSAAVQAAMQACQLTKSQRAGYVDTLAAAYAENRDFDKAIETQKQALLLECDAKTRAEMEWRLGLYQRHQPYREEPSP
jgi:tetratricopeptide (TPR) repeat protein